MELPLTMIVLGHQQRPLPKHPGGISHGMKMIYYCPGGFNERRNKYHANSIRSLVEFGPVLRPRAITLYA